MKRYLLEWLKGLLRAENLRAAAGSLNRRILRRNFLEMDIALGDETLSPSSDAPEIRRYSEDLEGECIGLLNSIVSLGFWSRCRFRKKILSSVENPGEDIFVLCETGSVAGFAVLHKRARGCDSSEIGYIAIRPESRGKKLGYRLIMHLLAEMRKRKIPRAYLLTDSFRIPAIKTYLRVGFRPDIKNEGEQKRWRKIMDKIRPGEEDKDGNEPSKRYCRSGR